MTLGKAQLTSKRTHWRHTYTAPTKLDASLLDTLTRGLDSRGPAQLGVQADQFQRQKKNLDIRVGVVL